LTVPTGVLVFAVAIDVVPATPYRRKPQIRWKLSTESHARVVTAVVLRPVGTVGA